MEIKSVASGSSGNCYMVSDGETKLLLECGIDNKKIQRACKHKLVTFDGCLISHEHKDHCKAAKNIARKAIDIYASQGTIDNMGFKSHHLKPIKSLESFKIKTFLITPFDVKHDAAEPLGFFIISTKTDERILFFTDTSMIKYKFDGVTHLMAECNYDIETMKESVRIGKTKKFLAKRIIRNHMSLDHVIKYIDGMDKDKLEQIYLIHLSDNNCDHDLCKQKIQKLTGTEVYVCEKGR